MLEDFRHILDLIQNYRAVLKPVKKTIGICYGEVSFNRVVKTDVAGFFAGFVLQKGCFSGLPRACDEHGRKLLKRIIQNMGKRPLYIHI